MHPSSMHFVFSFHECGFCAYYFGSNPAGNVRGDCEGIANDCKVVDLLVSIIFTLSAVGTIVEVLKKIIIAFRFSRDWDP